MAAGELNRIRDKVFSYHSAGQYHDALSFLKEAQSSYPEFAGDLVFWRLCFASLSQDSALACEVLEGAIANGIYFPYEILQADPDLCFVLLDPQFQMAAAASHQEHLERIRHTEFVYRIREPKDEAKLDGTAILFHGNKSNADQTLDQWRGSFSTTWRLIAVQSLEPSYSQHSYLWFNEEAIDSVVAQTVAVVPPDPGPSGVVLAGFSRGCLPIAKLWQRQLLRTSGGILIGPAIPKSAMSILDSTIFPDTVLCVVGEHDQFANESAARIKSLAGDGAEIRTVPNLGHDFPQELPSVVSEFISNL